MSPAGASSGTTTSTSPVRTASGRTSSGESTIAEAAVVRRIFDLTAQGYGRKRVVQILNEDGAVSPRAQRGRPHAWCPSSVHEALHRELYRGVIVWNRSQKRDRWGRHRQHARDASEWMRVDAPGLRIIPDTLWNEVHDRMARRHAVYLDRTGGKAHGRPLTGTVSPYLLTGFVSCGCCAGSLIVRSRPHRRRREPWLACYYYMTRGTRVCANKYEAPLAGLDALVLDAIEQDMLAADVGEPAIAQAVDLYLQGQADSEQGARDVSKELADPRSRDGAVDGACGIRRRGHSFGAGRRSGRVRNGDGS